MPEHTLDAPQAHTRIDLAVRLDDALDRDAAADRPFHGDPLAGLLSLAAEIRGALQQPLLTPADRRRIHARALDIAERPGPLGLRRAWPQLVQLGSHPAVIGGAAAAVLAVVGVGAVALRDRRGHGAAAPAPAA